MSGVPVQIKLAHARADIERLSKSIEQRDAEIATLKARVEPMAKCSTCGGDPKSHPSGKPCVCGDGTRDGEVMGLRRAAIDVDGRVEAAERERTGWKQATETALESLRIAHAVEAELRSRAQRAEALLGYAEHFLLNLSDGLAITALNGERRGKYIVTRSDGAWLKIDGTWLLYGNRCDFADLHFPDLNDALRALADAGLLPDALKVSE